MIICDRCHIPLDKERVTLIAQRTDWDALNLAPAKNDLCLGCTSLLTEWIKAGTGASQAVDQHNAQMWARQVGAECKEDRETPRIWVSQGPQGLSEKQLQEALKEVRSRMEFWNGR